MVRSAVYEAVAPEAIITADHRIYVDHRCSSRFLMGNCWPRWYCCGPNRAATLQMLGRRKLYLLACGAAFASSRSNELT